MSRRERTQLLGKARFIAQNPISQTVRVFVRAALPRTMQLRQYLPKRTDFSGYAQSGLDKIATRLNQRPRKTLGFVPRVDFEQVLRRRIESTGLVRQVEITSELRVNRSAWRIRRTFLTRATASRPNSQLTL